MKWCTEDNFVAISQLMHWPPAAKIPLPVIHFFLSTVALNVMRACIKCNEDICTGSFGLILWFFFFLLCPLWFLIALFYLVVKFHVRLVSASVASSTLNLRLSDYTLFMSKVGKYNLTLIAFTFCHHLDKRLIIKASQW